MSKDHFGVYFVNSLVVAVSATALTVLIAGMLAYAFSRLDFPGREPLFYVFLVGMMIPPVMLIIPQFIVAKYLHLLNSLLGLTVVYVTMNLALQTFLLRGFFEGVPRDLEEAARIDGASHWTIFRRIVLPLSRPGLAVVAIFTFLYSWDEFPWAHVAIQETSRRTLPIAIALFQSEHLTEWGQVFAASIVALIPVVIVFVAVPAPLHSGHRHDRDQGLSRAPARCLPGPRDVQARRAGAVRRRNRSRGGRLRLPADHHHPPGVDCVPAGLSRSR